MYYDHTGHQIAQIARFERWLAYKVITISNKSKLDTHCSKNLLTAEGSVIILRNTHFISLTFSIYRSYPHNREKTSADYFDTTSQSFCWLQEKVLQATKTDVFNIVIICVVPQWSSFTEDIFATLRCTIHGYIFSSLNQLSHWDPTGYYRYTPKCRSYLISDMLSNCSSSIWQLIE